MAKVKLDYMSLSLRAEGSDDVVRELSGRFLDMAEKYGAPGVYFNVPPVPDSIFADGCRDPEEVEPLTEPKEVAPGADWDVVAIYDDAGIPSIMHRFRRVSNKELFGGSDKPHPAFIIGGEVYDEIYISVYQNVMIHGKPYSLPYADPATGFTADEFAKACFSKGEGWHPLTAAEWGLLANLSYAIVTTFGKVEDGTKDAGVVFKAPWQSIVKMDNRVQEMNMDLSAFSSDIQEVATSVAVGYRINQQNAMTIYKSVGKKYEDTLITPRVQETVKAVVAHYDASSLISNRDAVASQMDTKLREVLAEYNIDLQYISVTNFDFTDTFTDAVEANVLFPPA